MQLPDFRRSLGLLVLLAAVYALMLLRWGYEFGRNDQMQTLAYTEFLAQEVAGEATDWPRDFYLQGIHERIPNERYVFSRLWVPFAEHMAVVSLLGHVLFSLLLLHALWLLGGLWIRSLLLRLALPLLLFIPLYGVSLGGNELWYNSFFVSNVVKVLGLYAVLALLKGRRAWAFLGAGVATLLQPVVGLHLFGLCLGASLWEGWHRSRRSSALRTKSNTRFWKQVAFGAVIWLLSGGIWILFLKLHFEEEALSGTDRFFDILYVFRAPHHYWPPSWSAKDWVLEGGLLLFGLVWFSLRAMHPAPPGENSTRRAQRVQGLFLAGFLAAGLYALAMPLLRPVWLGAVQGFKSTIFLEAFAVLALLAAVQDFLPFLVRPFWKRSGVAALLLAGLVAGGVLWAAPERLPWNVPHDFALDYSTPPSASTPEVQWDDWDYALDIALHIRAAVPRDALFAHPIGFTELKFHGRRSAYVDYKVLVHTRAAMHEWARRIDLLYGLSPEGERLLYNRSEAAVPDRYARANAHFHHADASLMALWRAEGISHVLTFRGTPAAQYLETMGQGPLVQNARYAVYTLPDF